jgi:SlyX protein
LCSLSGYTAVMNESRLIELETKLAYLEETLQVLNQVVARQQKQIDLLEAQCRELRERARNASEEGVFRGTPADEVPPHY